VNDLRDYFSKENNTKTIILKNKEVTKENVLKIKEILKQTTEQDKVIISCSSHGLLDKNNNFYLAMTDVDFNQPELRGLAYEDLQGLLDGIPARKKLLLLDACNSGENEKSENKETAKSKKIDIKEGSKGIEIETVSDSYNTKNSFETMMELFVNVNNQTGATIISAAGGKQSAFEGKAVLVNGKPISNGAFTYSIIEYLTQNKNNKNKLTVNQLKQYVEQRVSEITEGKQKPTSRQETMEVDWRL
jgi:predicted RND superfamily exporter protein